MQAGGEPVARGFSLARQAACAWLPRWWAGTGLATRGALMLALLAVIAAAPITTRPRTVEAEQALQVWRSPQFGLRLTYPTSWAVVEQRVDPERGDVVILGNETSALLVGLLHDTRTPRQMADDLLRTQKEQTPDLAVIQAAETDAGSVLMLLQYTIKPGSDAAMLIDEKVLLGTLQAGVSTITLRGMVPDRADVERELETIEGIIGTLAPDRR